MKIFAISATVAALVLSGISSAACAATVGVGFNEVGIHAGNGLNMSLPGGYLTAMQHFGHFSVSGQFTGAGGKNDATFYAGHVQVGKSLNLDGLGTITPALRMGFQSFNVMGGNLSAATAMVHIGYRYAITPDVGLYAGGGFGRDFETSVADLSTIGGLMYTADVGADFKIGPGTFNVGGQYAHLPLSSAAGLHLNTDQLHIGYQMRF